MTEVRELERHVDTWRDSVAARNLARSLTAAQIIELVFMQRNGGFIRCTSVPVAGVLGQIVKLKLARQVRRDDGWVVEPTDHFHVLKRAIAEIEQTQRLAAETYR